MKAKNNEHIGATARQNNDHHVAAFVERALGINMADELANLKIENDINKAAAANSYREWFVAQDALDRHERAFAHYLKYCEALEADMLGLMKALETAEAALTEMATHEVQEMAPKQIHGQIVHVRTGKTRRPAEEALNKIDAIKKGMQT